MFQNPPPNNYYYRQTKLWLNQLKSGRSHPVHISLNKSTATYTSIVPDRRESKLLFRTKTQKMCSKAHDFVFIRKAGLDSAPKKTIQTPNTNMLF
jgi:hypothetical protein